MVFVSAQIFRNRIDWSKIPENEASTANLPYIITNSTNGIPLAPFVATIYPPPSLYQRGCASFLSTTEKIEYILREVLQTIETFLQRHVPSLVQKVKNLTTEVADSILFFVTTYPIVSGIAITITLTLSIIWVVKRKKEQTPKEDRELQAKLAKSKIVLHILRSRISTLQAKLDAHNESVENPEQYKFYAWQFTTLYTLLCQMNESIHTMNDTSKVLNRDKGPKEAWAYFLSELACHKLKLESIVDRKSAANTKEQISLQRQTLDLILQIYTLDNPLGSESNSPSPIGNEGAFTPVRRKESPTGSSPDSSRGASPDAPSPCRGFV